MSHESPVSESPGFAEVIPITATLDLLLQKLADIIGRHAELPRSFLDGKTARKSVKNDFGIDGHGGH
jgi:hypothetical protein